MRRFTVDDWQQRLNRLNQPLIIVGKHRIGNTRREMFTIQCYKCGGTFEEDRRSIYQACRSREADNDKVDWCPICNGHLCVTGINDIATKRKDLVKYFDNPHDAEKYSEGSGERVVLYCPECGQPKEMRIADLCNKGFHCDYCSDSVSFPNKIIRNLILQLPVDEYDFEHVDTWTENKRYDCYFSYGGKKYLVEMDGEQHSKNTSWSTKEWQENNDTFKSQLAMDNGFELIRIKAYFLTFDYIKKNIMDSRLSEIFDLSQVNWDEIYEKTITNFNIVVGKFYMEHKDMMLGDIAKHFYISYPTLKSILKKLTTLGLCDYSKEESIRNGRKCLAKRRTEDNDPFVLYSPKNEMLGEFKNAKDCYHFIVDTFGEKNMSFEVMRKCIFKGDSYKGYRFEYKIGLLEHHKKYNPIIFTVCNKYNDGKAYKAICQETGLSSSTIYKFLAAGNNMGICEYHRRERKAVSA